MEGICGFPRVLPSFVPRDAMADLDLGPWSEMVLQAIIDSSRVCNPPSADCALQSTKTGACNSNSRSGEAPISPTGLSNDPIRAGAASGEITPP